MVIHEIVTSGIFGLSIMEGVNSEFRLPEQPLHRSFQQFPHRSSDSASLTKLAACILTFLRELEHDFYGLVTLSPSVIQSLHDNPPLRLLSMLQADEQVEPKSAPLHIQELTAHRTDWELECG